MAFWKHRQMLAAGARAPELELTGLDGSRQTLAQILARGPAVLAFFKVSCPVCQYTFPFLERVYQGAGREAGPVQIFGVSQDNARSTQGFGEEFGVTFPVFLDESARDYPASNGFGISSVPSVFVIEPDGNISAAETGFSKRFLETLGHRMGVAPFHAGERVPEQRPG